MGQYNLVKKVWDYFQPVYLLVQINTGMKKKQKNRDFAEIAD